MTAKHLTRTTNKFPTSWWKVLLLDAVFSILFVLAIFGAYLAVSKVVQPLHELPDNLETQPAEQILAAGTLAQEVQLRIAGILLGCFGAVYILLTLLQATSWAILRGQKLDWPFYKSAMGINGLIITVAALGFMATWTLFKSTQAVLALSILLALLFILLLLLQHSLTSKGFHSTLRYATGTLVHHSGRIALIFFAAVIVWIGASTALYAVLSVLHVSIPISYHALGLVSILTQTATKIALYMEVP